MDGETLKTLMEGSNKFSALNEYSDIEEYLDGKYAVGLKTEFKDMVDHKGAFSYISWPYSVKELFSLYPLATWVYEDFDGKPYYLDEGGGFVRVYLQLHPLAPLIPLDHPILDNKNKPILAPDAFDINRTKMRALSKVISIATGLGLSLYVGEDLPDDFVGGIEVEDEIRDRIHELLNGELGDRMLNGKTLRETYYKRLESANWSRKIAKEILRTLEAL